MRGCSLDVRLVTEIGLGDRFCCGDRPCLVLEPFVEAERGKGAGGLNDRSRPSNEDEIRGRSGEEEAIEPRVREGNEGSR